jgi:hypothetical protein
VLWRLELLCFKCNIEKDASNSIRLRHGLIMSPSPSMSKFCKNFLKISALEINFEFRFIDRTQTSSHKQLAL